MQTVRQTAKQLLQRRVLEVSAIAGVVIDKAVPNSLAAGQLSSNAALRLLAASPLTSGARASLHNASSSTRACFSSCQLLDKALQDKPALKRHVWPSCASHALGASFYSTRASQQGRMRLSYLQQKKSGEQGLYIIAFVVAMVGVTYASVPLYRYSCTSDGSDDAVVLRRCEHVSDNGQLSRMFCQATGYGGTVQQGQTVEEKLRKQVIPSCQCQQVSWGLGNVGPVSTEPALLRYAAPASPDVAGDCGCPHAGSRLARPSCAVELIS